MRKAWNLLEQEKKILDDFIKSLGVSPLLARLLLNRSIKDIFQAEKFLSQSFYDLPDPFLLKDMPLAVGRLKKAIKNKEKILISGDYDVDGITSLTLLYEFLKGQGLEVIPYLPHRIEEGYGISINAVKIAQKEAVSLFISVDCGITAYDEIEELFDSGIDVIIIDHHRPRESIKPKAYAMIDPWQETCLYPEKDLAAVGLVFKLLQAMEGSLNNSLLELLDLVCLGTVADVAGLKGENRIFVKLGLQFLKNTKRLGLKQLYRIAGLKPESISIRNIAFIIAPRLNAVGRIDSAQDAFRLLIASSDEEADSLANKLERFNKKRREIEAAIFKQASNYIENEFDFSSESFLIVKGEDWHPGVLGIVASKLSDNYYCPSIVLSESGDLLKGSGRSIPEFNIFDAISSCSDILDEFGGHAGACGVVLKKQNFDQLRSRLNLYAKEVSKEHPFIPKLDIDAELDFESINAAFFEDIEKLSPFGAENPEPIFLTKSVRVISEPRLLARNFYKIWVKKGNYSHQALLKPKNGEAESIPALNDLIDIVYSAASDIWEGVKSVTLFLEDYRLSPQDNLS